MGRNPITKINVSTSKHNLMLKPYGFCCDIKDHDPTLHIKDPDFEPLFPCGVTGGGPDIKFRIQDADIVSPSALRSNQKSSQRSGRGGYRSGHEGGPRRSRQEGGLRRSKQEGGPRRSRQEGGLWRSRQEGGYRGNQRDGQSPRQWQRQGAYTSRTSESQGEQMICKRCRSPLRWYLEDEISVARDRMMGKRQSRYNAELDANVKIAIEKEKVAVVHCGMHPQH